MYTKVASGRQTGWVGREVSPLGAHAFSKGGHRQEGKQERGRQGLPALAPHAASQLRPPLLLATLKLSGPCAKAAQTVKQKPSIPPITRKPHLIAGRSPCLCFRNHKQPSVAAATPAGAVPPLLCSRRNASMLVNVRGVMWVHPAAAKHSAISTLSSRTALHLCGNWRTVGRPGCAPAGKSAPAHKRRRQTGRLVQAAW